MSVPDSKVNEVWPILCSGLKGRRPFWLLNPPSRGGGGVLALFGLHAIC